ncbi:hypothetical protein DIE22_30995 [Burkholderia sp. Bp9142]|nr:hypothetical protein DIE22_30995 [Burkholderia sp. Bp9142]
MNCHANTTANIKTEASPMERGRTQGVKKSAVAAAIQAINASTSGELLSFVLVDCMGVAC